MPPGFSVSRQAKQRIAAGFVLFVLTGIIVLKITGSSNHLERTSVSPFQSSLSKVGISKNVDVISVDFSDQDSQPLGENKIYLVHTPAGFTPLPMDVALGMNVDYFGYKYSDSNATEEIKNKNALLFSQRFPSGNFFASGKSRNQDSTHANSLSLFEQTRGVQLRPTGSGGVLFEPSSLYILIINDPQATISLHPAPVCGDNWKAGTEECDAGSLNGTGPALCTTECKIGTAVPYGTGSISISVLNASQIATQYKTYFMKGWATTGRNWLKQDSGVMYSSGSWIRDDSWPQSFIDLTAQEAYYAMLGARIGVDWALGTQDIDMMDELSKYYVSFYQNRVTTLGDLRAMQTGSGVSKVLLGASQGADSVHTMIWIEKLSATGSRLRDCYLCNAQFLHPASRLIRTIASLPAASRTPDMTQFATLYTQWIAREHVLRFDASVVATLKNQLIKNGQPGFAYSDAHVMVVAAAAEMLGANQRDPSLVSLTADEKQRMKDLVDAGITLLRAKRTVYHDTRDFDGNIVDSASYFNGDYDGYVDNDYSGYEGQAYPTINEKSNKPGISWDVSHFFRVPFTFRSFIDNKGATGTDFPTDDEVRLLANQYMYRVFRGDFQKPIIRNFFDGTDGWYRVSYHHTGKEDAIAPSLYCSMSDSGRSCLTTAGIYAWGELASQYAPLATYEAGLLNLAKTTDPVNNCFQSTCFREVHYKYGLSFSFVDKNGKEQYPFMLLTILSELALGQQ